MAVKKFEIPEIPAQFVIQLKNAPGKDFITANGLIYLGHMQGLKRIEVKIIHEPTKDDPTAIVFCEVETDLGVFSDFGEVNPSNKGTVGGSYPLSMATTRARNRALRIATGCPMTSYEEMGMDVEEAVQRPAQRTTPAPTPTPTVLLNPTDDKKAFDLAEEWRTLQRRCEELGHGLVAMPTNLSISGLEAKLKAFEKYVESLVPVEVAVGSK